LIAGNTSPAVSRVPGAADSNPATFDQETHTTTAEIDNMALATRSSRLRVRRLRWAFDVEGKRCQAK
jgi:hypothetical protein